MDPRWRGNARWCGWRPATHRDRWSTSTVPASKPSWGDVLFAGGEGRFNFPGNDGPTLLRSIREQLLTLPDDYQVLPGHGPATTIGCERRSNPYLQRGMEPLFEG